MENFQNQAEIKRFFVQKTILVSGAGGSIGSEICRQLAIFEPAEIILLDNNEYFLWKIRLELAEIFPSLKIISCLADITARARLKNIFREKRPHIVFHAAALKHVKIVEENPCEGLLINTIGTRILSEISCQYDVENFIFLSTDKAVEPQSRMGASKRIAELWLRSFNDKPGNTVFSILRFGNVAGSAGSVIPLFEHQIACGGPVTLTHEEVSRYFMTAQEAVVGLLEAAFHGGRFGAKTSLFVLNMGDSIRILDLARQMISESGRDIDIKMIGLEKGEKLQEKLIYSNERSEPVKNASLFHVLSEEKRQEYNGFEQMLLRLEELCRQSNHKAVLDLLGEILPDFPLS